MDGTVSALQGVEYIEGIQSGHWRRGPLRCGFTLRPRLRRYDGRSAGSVDVAAEDAPRIVTGLSEFDRVMGGGLVKGGVSLIGGDPGIGKSTLLLQVMGSACAAGLSCIYVR